MKVINKNQRLRRKKRVSSNIFGTKEKPRFSVFRSNKYIYIQAIDDEKRITLASFSSLKLRKEKNITEKEKQHLTKTEEARLVGINFAKILKEKNIITGVFDRGSYSYGGRVKALAEGLREGGVKI